MEVLIVADEPLLAHSLEATLDLGGHEVLGPAATAAAALALAAAGGPGLAFVHVGLRDDGGGGLARALRDRFGVPSFLIGTGAARARARADRAAAWGLVREPCGSRAVLRAVRIAQGLREGRGPRGRLPRQVELFHRPKRSGRPKGSNVVPFPPGRRTRTLGEPRREDMASFMAGAGCPRQQGQ